MHADFGERIEQRRTVVRALSLIRARVMRPFLAQHLPFLNRTFVVVPACPGLSPHNLFISQKGLSVLPGKSKTSFKHDMASLYYPPTYWTVIVQNATLKAYARSRAFHTTGDRLVEVQSILNY